MITIKLQADSMVFKDVTAKIKKEILDTCDKIRYSRLTPVLHEQKGKDLIVTADHTDLYWLMFSLSFKFDIEII